jgi:Ni/Co efflux regulator RcnB
MFRRILTRLTVTALVGALTVAGHTQVWAKKDKHEKGTRHHAGHADDRHYTREHQGRHFADRERVVVREYYEDEFRRGKCPPGLAKKRNGCMPPGQAKKWRVGQRLPKDVVYYEVPRAITVQLPRPSPGYRYVRVASDILLIAVGTGMVVDAIEDLGRM